MVHHKPDDGKQAHASSLRMRYLRLFMPDCSPVNDGKWRICGCKWATVLGAPSSSWHYAHPEHVPCNVNAKGVRNPKIALAHAGLKRADLVETTTQTKETAYAVDAVEKHNRSGTPEARDNALAAIEKAERAKARRERERSAFLRLASAASGAAFVQTEAEETARKTPADLRADALTRSRWLEDLLRFLGFAPGGSGGGGGTCTGAATPKTVLLKVHPDKHERDKDAWASILNAYRRASRVT
jgi:hypothetical protein